MRLNLFCSVSVSLALDEYFIAPVNKLTDATASLKLEGSDTQTQAVYAELKRIQQYFGKIKNIETPEVEESRSLTVNQEAAARILKADLVRKLTICQHPILTCR